MVKVRFNLVYLQQYLLMCWCHHNVVCFINEILTAEKWNKMLLWLGKRGHYSHTVTPSSNSGSKRYCLGFDGFGV